jgi:hypothetical protein
MQNQKKKGALSAFAKQIELNRKGYTVGGINFKTPLTPEEQAEQDTYTKTRLARALAKRERKALKLQARGL